MSTQPSITWTSLNNLGQTTSPIIKQTFQTIQTVVQTVDTVLNVVEQFIQIASIFLSTPSDLIGIFLKGGILLFDEAIKGAMSTGGSTILITPFNRMNPRKYNFMSDNPKDYPALSIPAMTIKESIDEFRASFSNTLDTGRPTWGNTAHAVGVGIIITCPELPSFTAVMKSITLLLNFDDFKVAGEKYEKLMRDQSADLYLQYKSPPKWAEPNVNALLQPLYEVFPYKDNVTGKLQASNYDPVSKALNPDTQKVVFNSTLPKLHWVGLNLYNFPFFQQLMSLIDETVAHLLTMVAATDSAICELAKALIKRVEVIKQFITQFISVAESLVMSINEVDILTFKVESFTGVSGILSAIDSSATSVPAVAANYTTNQFSSFLFIGAGTGVDLDAWKQSFFGLFGLLDEQLAANIAAINTGLNDISGAFKQLTPADFLVTPDFRLSKIYNYGDSFILKVMSQNIPDPSVITYCYTYSVMDEKSTVISSFNDRNLNIALMPIVNTSSINIILPKRSYVVTSATFSINITIFSQDALYLKDINLSFLFNAMNSDKSSRAIIAKPTSSNASPIRTLSTLTNDPTTSLFSAGAVTSGELGSGSGSGGNSGGGSGSTIGNTSIQVKLSDLSNNTTNIHHYGALNQVPTVVNSDSLPVTLCFNFVGAISYKLINDTTWTTLALPVCIVLSIVGKYMYRVQDINGVWSDIFFIQIGDSGTVPVC